MRALMRLKDIFDARVSEAVNRLRSESQVLEGVRNWCKSTLHLIVTHMHAFYHRLSQHPRPTHALCLVRHLSAQHMRLWLTLLGRVGTGKCASIAVRPRAEVSDVVLAERSVTAEEHHRVRKGEEELLVFLFKCAGTEYASLNVNVPI